MYGKDKNILKILLKAYPTKDNNGKIVGLVGVHNDTTSSKKQEKELIDKNQELEQINQLAVGRELKMNELKKEVNELLTKSGQKPKYEV